MSRSGVGDGDAVGRIYAHELINDYGVKYAHPGRQLRGAVESLKLRDVVAAIGSSTDSNMNRARFDGLIDYAPVADFGLLRTAVDVAARAGHRDARRADPGR